MPACDTRRGQTGGRPSVEPGPQLRCSAAPRVDPSDQGIIGVRLRWRYIHPTGEHDFLAGLNLAHSVVGWIPTVLIQGVAARKLFIWKAHREPTLAARNPHFQAGDVAAKHGL